MSLSPLPGIPGAGLFGTRLECWIEIPSDKASPPQPSDLALLPSPLTLRIFFNPIQALAVFRLQASVALGQGSDTDSRPAQPFYLQLLPQHLCSLGFDKLSLHFHLTRRGGMTLLGPAAIPVGDAALKTPALKAMAWLAQQQSFIVHLPARAEAHAQALTTLCEAISSSGKPLRADPFQTDLRSLYSGRGGRIIALPEVLDDETDDVPPVYADIVPAAPFAPLSPGPSTRKSKRPRTASSSESDVQSSRQLLDTRRAQVLSELVLQLDKKESCIRDLLEEMDAKSTRAAQQIIDMDAKSSRARQQMKQMDEQVQRLKELTDAATSTLEVSPAAPAPIASGLEDPADNHSTAACPSPSPSVASATSNTHSKISTRIQTHVERRLETLREELLAHNEE